ncbi:hypothetical protein DFH09DRAFT_1097656 [Mycena vulgaris]|nr:hypothetical protein DFH09DRAFT_1097656 [Mycena vulgaris]
MARSFHTARVFPARLPSTVHARSGCAANPPVQSTPPRASTPRSRSNCSSNRTGVDQHAHAALHLFLLPELLLCSEIVKYLNQKDVQALVGLEVSTYSSDVGSNFSTTLDTMKGATDYVAALLEEPAHSISP